MDAQSNRTAVLEITGVSHDPRFASGFRNLSGQALERDDHWVNLGIPTGGNF